MPHNILTKLKDPRYTGSNRCFLCTAVNCVIAVIIAMGLAMFSGVLGALSLVIAGLAISLRGYLIPVTPTLTKRYFPGWLLEWFGKTPEVEHDGLVHMNSVEVDLEARLVRMGVLELCPSSDDLCLVDPVRETWESQLDEITEVSPELVSEITCEHAPEYDLVRSSESIAAFDSGEEVGRWPSAAAFLTDVTAARTMNQEYGGWTELTTQERGQLLTGLRLFVPNCPRTGEEVKMTEETVESCCSTHQVVALRCLGSEERILEQPVAT